MVHHMDLKKMFNLAAGLAVLMGFDMQAENSSRNNIDALNKLCYDNRADYWDRFPYPDALPDFVSGHYKTSLGNKVLDIGSGTGVLAQWLQKQGFEVLCLDPSYEMVRRSREKGLQTISATLQSYQPDDQKFAMVFAILSMIHVPKNEWPSQIEKIAKMLPPHGLLFLGMIEGDSEGIEEQQSGYPRFFVKYRREEIPKLFEQQFKLVDFRASPKTPSYLLFAFERK